MPPGIKHAFGLGELGCYIFVSSKVSQHVGNERLKQTFGGQVMNRPLFTLGSQGLS